MTVLLGTIKRYWKFLLILTSVCGFIVTASAWVSKVDVHVNQGNEKIREFDNSEKERARTDEKVDAVLKELGELKQEVKEEFKEIKEQNKRIERKLDRGTR